MKFFHISDIHLGKKVNGYSMMDEQRYILGEILRMADEEKPDAVVIAGDIYDRTYPSPEAVALCDEFLFQLSSRSIAVLAISGNHDSPERVAFGSRIFGRSGIHLSPVYDGHVEPVVLSDEYGSVNFYMLPFIRPYDVRRYFPDEEIETYDDAVKKAVNDLGVDFSVRNVLITHQFVSGAKNSDSEEVMVGGTNQVEVSAFAGFDYTALGHLHRPQHVKSEIVRYSGAPLKYSTSEANDTKSVTVAELRIKGDITLRQLPLTPKHDLRIIKGKFEELISPDFDCGGANDDYIHIVLTDEDDVPDAVGKLRSIYPRIMTIEYDNTRTRMMNTVEMSSDKPLRAKSSEELFEELYELQNGTCLTDTQKETVREIMTELQEGET
ncbi:MAG: exonuclease SbcCD subunit D [Eubacteriales bacterium]|jgi:exonuclease SbcD|nr:exonuclease SbcCD subunit D [Eubacteriales bacterium]